MNKENEQTDNNKNRKYFSLILLLAILPICAFKLFLLTLVLDESMLVKSGLRIVLILLLFFLWRQIVPDIKKRENQLNKTIYLSAVVFSGLIFIMMIGMLWVTFSTLCK